MTLIRRLTLAFALSTSAGLMANETLTIKPHSFEAPDGTTIEAEWGEMKVPLFHDSPEEGSITLSFLRFPATTDNPGAPLVYMAGGPGGVGSRFPAGHRYSLFMALREVGDVIAFNQRGTGPTANIPQCEYAVPVEAGGVIDRASTIDYYTEMAAYCGEFWAGEGVKAAAYNTRESAGDIEALRKALGVQKLNLWGISYGTHLTMAALKYYPDSFERVVMTSPEGLDQTVKMPAYTDAYMERLGESMSSVVPGFVDMLRGVIEQLKAEPVEVTVKTGEGDETLTFRMGAYPVQLLISMGMISDPVRATNLPRLVYAMANGVFDPVAQVLYDNFLKGGFAGKASMSGMSTFMDAASGISPERLANVQEQAKSALLGDALNFPFPALFGKVPGVEDLGEEFRSPLSSDVPALMLSGTLDGRTYPEAHDEVARQFSDIHKLTVVNGGHNIFMVDPEITRIIVAFFRGQNPDTDSIVIPAPDWSIN